MKRKLNSILLIEDDRATNFLYEMIIEKTDCTEQILIAEEGQQALEILKLGVEGKYPQPDLIFLDINMPVMNGWEFIEEYKKLDLIQKGEIIIVMITASFNPDEQTRAETIKEISGFRNKPITVDMLNKILQEYFADRF